MKLSRQVRLHAGVIIHCYAYMVTEVNPSILLFRFGEGRRFNFQPISSKVTQHFFSLIKERLSGSSCSFALEFLLPNFLTFTLV